MTCKTFAALDSSAFQSYEDFMINTGRRKQYEREKRIEELRREGKLAIPRNRTANAEAVKAYNRSAQPRASRIWTDPAFLARPRRFKPAETRTPHDVRTAYVREDYKH